MSKSKRMVILIIFLLIIALLVGCFVIRSFNKKEKIDIKSGVVESLFSTFRMDEGCYKTVDGLNNSNLIKLRIAYEALPAHVFRTVECSKLSINSAEGLRCSFLEGHNETTSVDSKLLEAKVHELFGSDYKYKPEAFGLVVVEPKGSSMYYDEKNKIYAQYYGDSSINCYERSEKVVDAYKLGNKLYIETNYKYSYDDKESEKIKKKKSKLTYQFKWDEGYQKYVFDKVSEK